MTPSYTLFIDKKHEHGIAYKYIPIYMIKFKYTNLNKKYTINIFRLKVVMKREITL